MMAWEQYTKYIYCYRFDRDFIWLKTTNTYQPCVPTLPSRVPIKTSLIEIINVFYNFLCIFNQQNTYTNAEKLLTAAEELSQTGECDASDICSVAAELESHVAAFAARVQARRRRLQRAVNFYTHQSEVK